MALERLDPVGATVENRRARVAVAALFLTNGALFANLLPRYPEIKTDLALSNAAYGIAIAAFSAGALVAGVAAATLIRRFQSARVAVIGSIGLAIFVFAAAIAPSAVAVGAALFVAGACDSITDVAQNAHGLRVQRNYGRSIINSFHAVWSAGAVLGGAMGAAAIALNIPRGTHLGVSAVLFSVVVLVAYPFLLPGRDQEDHPAAHAERTGRASFGVYATLLALVLLAISGALVEDAGSSWATVYLRDGLGAPGAIAVSGYVAMVGFQFVGRLVGDRLVDRFGERTVVRAGGFITAVGMGAALALPSVPGTIAGFAAAGFGVATLIPATMHGADQLPGLRTGTGLTAVTWLMRVGFVSSPPIVGLIADATSLRVGLLVVPLAGAMVMVLAVALSPRRRSSRS
ncbi:MFS transporter [Mycolicibacterium agri]|uniref:MFS transporter n=1 Tax=Mycolicibacterium agri TaxID=36811 RepID=A0A2A7N214_MYCAG|nr:MFS transporter [Mycolicibacterium agri]PEG38092.1 MFS transporter [Mycolicibacterium agri]GFG48842.1 MFS transporter [Mycolicibacterium agri]